MSYLEKFLRRTWLKNIISGATVRNISVLMTGTFISSIIPIVTAPLMTRIFTTSDYGVIGLYISVSSLIGVLAFSHYSQGIMLAKELTEAREILWFSLVFSSLISALLLIVITCLFLFQTRIKLSEVGYWYFLMPVSLFFNGISVVLMAWANKVKSYKSLAYNRVIQAVITMIIQLSLGLLIKNETGLIAGLLAGQVMSAVLLIRLFIGKNEHGIGWPDRSSFKRIAWQYRNLLVYNTPTTFINTLINQVPIFLLQKFGGVSYVGSYNFTQRLLGLPQIFLSSAIVDVFKEKSSVQYHQEGNCQNIFLKTFKALFLIAVIPFTILGFFGPNLFEFAFGSGWKNAGVFAQFLSIMFFLRFVVSPLTYIYYIANKLKEHFALHILFLLLTVASFYIGDLLLEDKRYLILIYSLVYSGIYILYFVRSYKFSKISRLRI